MRCGQTLNGFITGSAMPPTADPTSGTVPPLIFAIVTFVREVELSGVVYQFGWQNVQANYWGFVLALAG